MNALIFSPKFLGATKSTSATECYKDSTMIFNYFHVFSGSNAFAIIRPPGHHAAPDRGCGFCIFNNVAICAKKVIKLKFL